MLTNNAELAPMQCCLHCSIQ